MEFFPWTNTGSKCQSASTNRKRGDPRLGGGEVLADVGQLVLRAALGLQRVRSGGAGGFQRAFRALQLVLQFGAHQSASGRAGHEGAHVHYTRLVHHHT